MATPGGALGVNLLEWRKLIIVELEHGRLYK
jgi:hypothetical protein